MKHPLLTLFFLLALAGCQGTNSGTVAVDSPGNAHASSVLRLDFETQEQDSSWRVNLVAKGATDLYQAAGRVEFPTGQYQVLAVQAGGGLGGPQECYFVGKETDPGQVDFAYTKKFYGPGVDGDAMLVSLVVVPLGQFAQADFSLAGQPGVVVRNSEKQAIEIAGGVK